MLTQTEKSKVESHMGIAVSLATQYAKTNPRVSLEEMIQEGYLILCQAAKAYEKTANHKAQFSTYVWRSISHHLGKYCQRENKRVPTVSLIRQETQSSDWTYWDIPVPSPENQILQRIRDEEIQRTLMRYARRMRRNAKLGTAIFLCVPQEKIWNVLNMPYAKYSRCIQAARKDLSASKTVKDLFTVSIAG